MTKCGLNALAFLFSLLFFSALLTFSVWSFDPVALCAGSTENPRDFLCGLDSDYTISPPPISRMTGSSIESLILSQKHDFYGSQEKQKRRIGIG